MVRHAHAGVLARRLHLGTGAFRIAETVEHDVGALARQADGDTQANAAGGAGDEGSLAFEHEFFSETNQLRCNERIIEQCFGIRIHD